MPFERLQQVAIIAASRPTIDGTESWHELRRKCQEAIDAMAAMQRIADEYSIIIGRDPMSNDDFEKLKSAIRGAGRALEHLQEQYSKQTGRRLCA